MVQNNIMLFENDDKSYTIIDLYLNSKFLGYKDSYNYYDIDVDYYLILLLNKMMIVPLQLKIDNSYNEINAFKKNNKVMHIYNDDKEFFRKCIEIWDKIIELIGINNHIYFLKSDEDDKLFIMANVHKNKTFVLEDNYRYGHNKAVIVLHSVINNCIKTSLVQHRYK